MLCTPSDTKVCEGSEVSLGIEGLSFASWMNIDLDSRPVLRTGLLSGLYRECYVEWKFMSSVSESKPLSIVGTGSHPTVVLSRSALPCSRANRRQCESHRASRDTSCLSDQAPRSASAFDSIINLSGLARISIADYLRPPKSS